MLADLNDKDFWIEGVETSAAIKDTNLTLALADSSHEIYPEKNVLTVFTTELRNDGALVNTDPAQTNLGKFVCITDVPEMPALTSKVVPGQAPDTVDWNLVVEYQRTDREDEDTYASPSISVATPWNIQDQFGEELRGGRARLNFTYHGVNQRLTFHIRGNNPADTDVRTYIDANCGEHWYAYAIAKHESRAGSEIYNQFNLPTQGVLGPGWDDYQSAPNRHADAGGTYGWGLFQLTRTNEPVPWFTARALWDWKNNTDRCIYLLNLKRNNPEDDNSVVPFMNRQRAQESEFRNGDPSTLPNLVCHYAGTYDGRSYDITFQDGVPNRSIEDLLTIQAYNGAALYEVFWDNSDPDDENWEWRWRDSNQYVRKIFSEME